MAFFRVATEGATADGRNISKEWIQQMAANFDRSKYGARVWMEHMRGVFPDGPFQALGDVTALKTETVEDGKLGLFAAIDPTDRLKQMISDRQKVYTSIEVDPDFAGTGQAYMVGLAVTDSPASLGTEMLQFSVQQGEKSPLAPRKQHPRNHFTAAVETSLDFSEEAPHTDNGPSLSERVKALFKRNEDKRNKQFSEDLEATFGLMVERFNTVEKALEQRPTAETFSALKEDHKKLQERFDQLYRQLDNTPDLTPRSPATGGDATELTDC